MVIDKIVFFKRILILIIGMLGSFVSYATHIRAGEITATHLSGTTYEIKVTGYRDASSIVPFGGGNNPILNYGDGTSINFIDRLQDDWIETSVIENNIQKVEITLFHTYGSNGNYVITYSEGQRNGNIINMTNSIGTDFYIETLLVIDEFLGDNSSPVLTVPPVDYAAIGATFIHNPGAFDPDGDSLSYEFITPRQKKGLDVSGYKRLNDASFYTIFSAGSEQGTPPQLSINAITGDLIWNAPGDITNQSGEGGICQGEFAEYNVALKIEEWRKILGRYYKVGFVVRDMQIVVCDTDNEPPVITPLEDICVEAGEQVQQFVFATDPDGHPVKLEAFGGPFEVNNTATYSPFPAVYQSPLPARLDFKWTTGCLNVRERPYEVQFKATDDPEIGPSLVDFESFQITVLGPAPEGVTTQSQTGRSIAVSWDLYQCTEALNIQVWRKVGATNLDIDECQMGMPPNTGYRMIDEVNVSTTSYLDDNDGRGLNPGAKYCYRLVATYPSPGGGMSYVSAESCDSLLIDVPVITNVDVQSTSVSSGEVLVRCTHPIR